MKLNKNIEIKGGKINPLHLSQTEDIILTEEMVEEKIQLLIDVIPEILRILYRPLIGRKLYDISRNEFPSFEEIIRYLENGVK